MTREQWNGPWCNECDTGVDSQNNGHAIDCIHRNKEPAPDTTASVTDEIFDRQRAGFDRCFETLGITDYRERSWSSLVLALTDVAADAARYRFIRDDNDWHQNDRYWEALSAGGDKLDKTVDDGIKSRAEQEADDAL
jgi:hypothetical protein